MRGSVIWSRSAVVLLASLASVACGETSDSDPAQGGPSTAGAPATTPENGTDAPNGGTAAGPESSQGGAPEAMGGGGAVPPPPVGGQGASPAAGGQGNGTGGMAPVDPNNQLPSAAFTFTRNTDTPTSLAFDASESMDPDGPLAEYLWDFGDGSTGAGELAEHAFMTEGCFEVKLTVVDAAGATAEYAVTVSVKSEAAAAESGAMLDPLPRDSAVLPRNVETNEATLTVSGSVAGAGYHTVSALLKDDAGASQTFTTGVCDGEFSLPISIPAALRNHELSISLQGNGAEQPLGTAKDLVAGDIIVVQGQSNAEAARQRGDANGDQSPFIRTFGNHGQDAASVRDDDTWRIGDGDRGRGAGAIGQWSLRMSALLIERFNVPIAIINQANGGKPIDFFQRDDGNPGNLNNNYGRLYHRLTLGGLKSAVRAIIFYQGEADGAAADKHKNGFTALHRDWLTDYPNVEHVYVTQVRQGCADVSVELQDVQRRFADTLPKTSVMTANGLSGHDGCHFFYAGGYKELGEWYAGLLGRDLYGAPPEPDTESIDVMSAALDGNEIRVMTRGDVSAINVDAGVAADFSLIGSQRRITSVTAEGTTLVLGLSAGNGGPSRVRYAGHTGQGGPWITNANGIGLLAFDLAL